MKVGVPRRRASKKLGGNVIIYLGKVISPCIRVNYNCHKCSSGLENPS